MATEMHRQRWAVYDHELADSDQTISVSRRAAAALASPATARRRDAPLPLAARPSQPGSRKRPPVKSAYFVETTDDDELSRHGATALGAAPSAAAASRNTRTGRPQHALSSRHASASASATSATAGAPELLVPRLHIGEIQFPVTRSVLWDRRVLAEPIGVSIEQVLPRFTVAADALKRVFELFRDARASRSSEALCYLCGDAAALVSTKQLVLSTVATTQRKDKWDPNVVWVPVHAVSTGAETDQTLELPQAAYATAIAAAQRAFGDERSDTVSSKLSPRLLVAPSSVHSAQLEFQLECCAPPLLFRFALIRSLPLLMTPLAAGLSRQEFGAGPAVRRSGYLTLDRARKAVPVLRTDPLVLQRPIVGVWVYGVPLSDEWSDATARAQMADPYVYFACLTYVASQTIRERVELSANTFLVAIYPSGHASSLPRFFECSFSELVDRARGAPLPIELYAQHQSCLVGAASFASDVDFALSSSPSGAWERAKTECGIPTTRSTLRERSDEDAASRAPATSEHVLAALQHSTDTWEAARVRRPFAASAGPTMRRADGEAERSSQHRQCVDRHDKLASRVSSNRSFQGTDSRESFTRVTFESPQSGDSENVHPNTARPVESFASDREPSDRKTHQCASSLPALVLSPPHRDDHKHETSAADVPSPVRSCCKTQALLTIQHQQILENQQRQLHEMQEQIAHLRQLLRASKALDPASLDTDLSASHAFDTRDDSTRAHDETHQGSSNQCDGEASDSHVQRFGTDESLDGRYLPSADAEEPLAPETSNADPSGETRSDGNNSSDDATAPSVTEHADVENDGEEERGDTELASDSESSLHLSSLSNASMRSDLSSLSSSLVSAQLKAKFRASADRSDASSSSRRSAASSRRSSSSMGREPHKRSSQVGPTDTVRNRTSFGLDSECKVDESDDDDDLSAARTAPFEKMLTPDSYLKRHGALMDRHGGSCYTTAPATLDLHSFCVPRIKFAPARSPRGFDASLSDSDDEEFRLIEQKYKRLLAS